MRWWWNSAAYGAPCSADVIRKVKCSSYACSNVISDPSQSAEWRVDVAHGRGIEALPILTADAREGVSVLVETIILNG